MKTSRRSILAAGIAAAGTIAAPSVLKAQTRPPAARTIRAVMHGDVPTYDPIWTTANMAAYHGGMVYDTLFGIDDKDVPQPQMVGKYGLSDDKLKWTFELRDGLKWHDGTAVTSADVVPSLKRWAARDGMGQLLTQRLKGIEAKDEKTFTIELKERFGLVLDALAKTGTPVNFMMRKKEAETDPMQKIDQTVGSGPFILNMNETRAGSQYVYDRNPNYNPRSEAPSGIAGGKVVKVDRVIYQNMPDSQTAVAALQAGEIDFYEIPPADFLGDLAADKNLKVETFNTVGSVGWIRPNWLHAPFNNVKARQALLYLIKQEDMMRPTFGDAKIWRTCGSLFSCGSSMENDANMAWFNGGPNMEKARQLVKESGYDGKPVVVMQATNIPYMMNAATVLAQSMRQAGFNVNLVPMDWSNVVQRRSSKNAPDQGGWNIFITSAGGAAMGNPVIVQGMGSNGDKGWFGWPSDELHEQLRAKWIDATTVDERKAIARQIQENAWNYVPHVYFGQWVQPQAYSAKLKNWVKIAEMVPFWGVEKG